MGSFVNRHRVAHALVGPARLGQPTLHGYEGATLLSLHVQEELLFKNLLRRMRKLREERTYESEHRDS